MAGSREPDGLSVIIDKVIYHHDENLPPERPHAFVDYITIRNLSESTVELLGRKWVIDYEDGTKQVIEGDGIVGQFPRIEPGEEFSYNSYHVTAQGGWARGAFHGRDGDGAPVHVKIPPFALAIPLRNADDEADDGPRSTP